jgi:23S rRNA (uracil1939-C5)-methyltransferase
MRFWANLTVEKLLPGGMGLARSPDGIIFVPDSAPGDVVDVEESGSAGGTPVAAIRTIRTPSPSRRDPSCQLCRQCGGCDWQHLTYAAQVRAKEAIIADCYRRIGKIANYPPLDIFESPEWGYRIRAQFQIDHAGRRIGFFQRDSHTIIDMDQCPLLADPLNELLRQKQRLLRDISPAVKQVKAIAGSNGVVASGPQIHGLTAHETEISVGELAFTVSGRSFFQGNRFLVSSLAGWARPWLGGDFFVDAYGGVGLFAVMLGDLFGEGIAIDSIPEQVALARRNFSRNGRAHVRAEAGDVESFLRGCRKKIDALIVDPPRVGLTKIARQSIAALRPRRILYVSCDPATQARDAGFFINHCGYAIEHAAMFDLYPQTHHVESVLLMGLS